MFESEAAPNTHATSLCCCNDDIEKRHVCGRQGPAPCHGCTAVCMLLGDDASMGFAFAATFKRSLTHIGSMREPSIPHWTTTRNRERAQIPVPANKTAHIGLLPDDFRILSNVILNGSPSRIVRIPDSKNASKNSTNRMTDTKAIWEM